MIQLLLVYCFKYKLNAFVKQHENIARDMAGANGPHRDEVERLQEEQRILTDAWLKKSCMAWPRDNF
jgi:hypothetical protein